VEILGRLEHPCITRLYAAGTIEAGNRKTPYFAMELSKDDLWSNMPAPMTCPSGNDGPASPTGGRHPLCPPSGHHPPGPQARNILVDNHGQPKILDFGVARFEQAGNHITCSFDGCRDWSAPFPTCRRNNPRIPRRHRRPHRLYSPRHHRL
jgi:serine/threonine protein kinase